MTQYKGLCIDHIFFHSKADIDRHLKTKAIEAYKTAVRYFANHPSIEASLYVDEKATKLVEGFNLTWEEVEALELESFLEI